MSAKDTIRRNKVDLIDCLCGDYSLILKKARARELITATQFRNLEEIKGADVEKHVIELVDLIMNRGENICKRFLTLLETDDAVKRTFPELVDINYRSKSLSQPVGVSSAQNGVRPVESQNEEDDFYEVSSRPTGLCVIINNKNFMDGSQRKGSDQDAVSLAEVFSWLGFRVLEYKDQIMNKMNETLRTFASLSGPTWLPQSSVKEWLDGQFTYPREAIQHGDVFICCILSHGEKGSVLGIDQKPLAIKGITLLFKSTAESALTAKPKVFLIQACQGKKIQEGVPVVELQSDDVGSHSIPEQADVLVALATVEDHVALRHIQEGSWFVQCLCHQLRQGCPRGYDIAKILHRVNNQVSHKEGAGQPGRVKQMSEFTSRLTKTLVLSPYDK